MSLLSITHDDTKGGKGQPLPAKTYRATIEQAEIRSKGEGTELSGVLGNLRTKEGATEFEHNGGIFRIGNRKVFFHHWTQHANAAAAEVGQRFIKKLLVSAGIVANPGKGETVQDPYTTYEELAADIVGHEVVLVTKQRSVKDAAGEVEVRAEISTYLAP